MGLLDDAIREHLELKRRRGADPTLVAHEERDALGLVRGGAPQSEKEQGTTAQESPGPEIQQIGGGIHGVDRSVAETPRSAGQETAELDMRSVLDDEPDEAPRNAVRAAAIDPVDHDRLSPANSPDESSSHEDEPEDQVEDLLEETPDFLRNTPDEDRLWFEQQPPQDFNFDG